MIYTAKYHGFKVFRQSQIKCAQTKISQVLMPASLGNHKEILPQKKYYTAKPEIYAYLKNGDLEFLTY